MMTVASKTWALPRSIHPPTHKAQSLREPIRVLPLPERLVIPLTQPGYAQPELFVKVGDQVLKGQLLARGTGALNLACHASSSGTVTAIVELPVPNASGIPELCAVIATDGHDEWQRMPPLDPATVDTEHLLARIGDAGISGLGGAGFPAQAKLRGALQRTQTLVINAAECEPFITADDMLLREQAESVVAGIAILLYLTTPERCLIGIEDDKPQAIAALRGAVAALGDTRISIVVIPTRYPSGAEKQLIYMLTGIEIPSGSYPIERGILCHNVGTCHAITRAVFHGEALISRIVTITGATLRRPGNFEALIGTPLSELLAACELDEAQLSRLIHGGPMMGVQLPHADLPLLKISNCVIAATDAELPQAPPAQACIRCGLCADACPVLLLPQQLYWFSRSKELDKAERHNLIDCIECGACAYVCPSTIPLVQYFRAAKSDLFNARDKQRMAEHSKQRFDFHQTRKAEEKAQEERRRQERAALVQQQKQDAPATAAAEDPIQAALARVQAKKAAQQAEAPQPSPQEVIQAALARVNAKKAEREAAKQAPPTTPKSDDENNPS
jgi:electron transport complex protein RnfC